MNEAGAGEKAGPFRARVKTAAYVVAWLAALFATSPTGSLWPVAYMFPLGLCAIFYPPALRDGGWGSLLLLAGVYVVHAVFYFRTKTRLSTVVAFVLLVILLTCNVAGCRSMLNTH